MTLQLTVDQVILIHREFVCDAPLLDRGKLEGAVLAPFQTWGGIDLFPSLVEKAAKLLEAINAAHAFGDGNKRISWLALTTFLQVNSLILEEMPDDEAADFVVDVVTHELEHDDVVRWLNDRVRIA